MHEFASFMFNKGYALFVAYEPDEEMWYVTWNPKDDRDLPIGKNRDPFEAFLDACRMGIQIEVVGRN